MQDARDHTKAELFEKAEDNVKYAYAVRDHLVTKGHFCKLLFSTHREVICQVQEIIIKEELTHQENNKEPTLESGKSRSDFANNWIVEHELLLNNALLTFACMASQFLVE